MSANLFSRDKKGSNCVPAALLPVSCTHIPRLFSTLIPKLKSEKAEAYSLMLTLRIHRWCLKALLFVLPRKEADVHLYISCRRLAFFLIKRYEEAG